MYHHLPGLNTGCTRNVADKYKCLTTDVQVSNMVKGIDRLNEIITTVDWTQVRLITLAVLTVACVELLRAAMAGFKRARLMLD